MVSSTAGSGACWHRPEIHTLRREVEQGQTQLHRPLTVGDGVVQLHDQRCTTARQTLQQGHPPQRAIPVEVGHALPAGVLEHIGPGRALRHAEAAHVEREVEVGVDHQARGLQSDRTFHHTRPQHRGQAGGALEALREHAPSRGWIRGRAVRSSWNASPGRRWPSARLRSPTRKAVWPPRSPASRAAGQAACGPWRGLSWQGSSSRVRSSWPPVSWRRVFFAAGFLAARASSPPASLAGAFFAAGLAGADLLPCAGAGLSGLVATLPPCERLCLRYPRSAGSRSPPPPGDRRRACAKGGSDAYTRERKIPVESLPDVPNTPGYGWWHSHTAAPLAQTFRRRSGP